MSFLVLIAGKLGLKSSLTNWAGERFWVHMHVEMAFQSLYTSKVLPTGLAGECTVATGSDMLVKVLGTHEAINFATFWTHQRLLVHFCFVCHLVGKIYIPEHILGPLSCW